MYAKQTTASKFQVSGAACDWHLRGGAKKYAQKSTHIIMVLVFGLVGIGRQKSMCRLSVLIDENSEEIE
jgi:hypothetical protein